MGHLTTKSDWGVVDLDTSTGRVFVQEDWVYVWLLYPGVITPWTLAEKRRFHRRVDIGVWKLWSNHLYLNVTGNAPFIAKRVPINFDVRWKVNRPADWTVNVWKVPPGSTVTNPIWSQVDWSTHEIRLNSIDVLERTAVNAAHQSTSNFRTPPHEFGHTMYLLGEYNAPSPTQPSPNLTDTNSIMNVGRQIRQRHLAKVVETLNKMLPGVRFAAQ